MNLQYMAAAAVLLAAVAYVLRMPFWAEHSTMKAMAALLASVFANMIVWFGFLGALIEVKRRFKLPTGLRFLKSWRKVAGYLIVLLLWVPFCLAVVFSAIDQIKKITG